MDKDRNGLEVLPRAECLSLLRRATIGRVAISVGALPAILPVNFTLVGEDIVFRTTAGAKMDAAMANNVIAFEADDVDPVYQTGWSVLVQGMASEVVEPEQVAEMRRAPLRAWAGNGRDHFVRLPTDHVSGRCIPAPTAIASTEGCHAAS
jgi:nitroimidazol reductase NimA-like FMN-containing flavoprotein (pyridoxamine 5'-phosphate oxidase superfamily)